MKQDYISLVNPSPSYLHKSQFESEHIQWGKGRRGTMRMQKFTVYPPTSYFGIGSGPEGYPQPTLIPKNLKIPITPLSDSLLNPKRDR